MAEYIDRTSFVERCEKAMELKPYLEQGLRTAIAFAFSAPAADVRENVKGEWLYRSGRRGKNIDGRTVMCSICGNFLYMGGVNGGRGDANFCPNCGTDCRGGAEDG